MLSWLPLGFLLIASIYDLRSREVPDWIAVAIFAWSLVAVIAGWIDVGWWSLVLGSILGLAVSLPLYARGAFGGGDVKLVVALGAAIGPLPLFRTLFWMAIVGGVMAVVALSRGKRDLAYVPAIALGLLINLIQSEFTNHAPHL